VDKDGSLRIGDFGTSRMMSDESLWATSARQVAGTLRWMAPELLDESASMVTKESNIYAFGMTALVCLMSVPLSSKKQVHLSLLIFQQETFTGEVPFFPHYRSNVQVLVAVLIRQERPIRPEEMRDWLWALLHDCWTLGASERLRVEEIVQKLEAVTYSKASLSTIPPPQSSPVEHQM
jgi:serine/threonine protein kinase